MRASSTARIAVPASTFWQPSPSPASTSQVLRRQPVVASCDSRVVARLVGRPLSDLVRMATRDEWQSVDVVCDDWSASCAVKTKIFPSNALNVRKSHSDLKLLEPGERLPNAANLARLLLSGYILFFFFLIFSQQARLTRAELLAVLCPVTRAAPAGVFAAFHCHGQMSTSELARIPLASS